MLSKILSYLGFTKAMNARTRSSTTVISVPINRVDDVLAALENLDQRDYLGKAAKVGAKARAAAAKGDFDGAWKLMHEQKQLYLDHARRSEFTPAKC